MPLCPKCGAEVAATDANCMDCGEDLLAAKEKERALLRSQSVAARTGTAGGSAVGPPKNPAAAGVAGVGERSSDETRLRAFDKQEAKRLEQERTTAWVTAGLALLIGIAFAIVGLLRIKAGGGFGDIMPALKPQALREGALFSPVVIGLMAAGTGLSGLLVGIGQIRLAVTASRAITDVKLNRKPAIAQVSTFTRLGLFLLCVFFPPLGFIIGLVMLFGRNPDLKGLGSSMTFISLSIMVLLGVNQLWKVFENMKSAKVPAPKS